MKHILLVAFLLPSALLAQTPSRAQAVPAQPTAPGYHAPSAALPDNYQVTLTITDKDDQPLEVSVVVASTRFNATLGEQQLNLDGMVTIEDSGSITIEYALGWATPSPAGKESVQFRQSSMKGSVRLKLGEEVQIIRAGSRIARLSITKLGASKPK